MFLAGWLSLEILLEAALLLVGSIAALFNARADADAQCSSRAWSASRHPCVVHPATQQDITAESCWC